MEASQKNNYAQYVPEKYKKRTINYIFHTTIVLQSMSLFDFHCAWHFAVLGSLQIKKKKTLLITELFFKILQDFWQKN
jgi:hypothetical protein